MTTLAARRNLFSNTPELWVSNAVAERKPRSIWVGGYEIPEIETSEEDLGFVVEIVSAKISNYVYEATYRIDTAEMEVPETEGSEVPRSKVQRIQISDVVVSMVSIAAGVLSISSMWILGVVLIKGAYSDAILVFGITVCSMTFAAVSGRIIWIQMKRKWTIYNNTT